MKSCPFCAEEIQDAAIKCKHCGEMLTKEDPIAALVVPEKPGQLQRSSSAELVIVKGDAVAGAAGAFVGLGCGMWVGGLMMFFGVLLCATGIGVILGIPLVLAGLMTMGLYPVIGGAGAMVERRLWRGPCPCCSHALDVSADLKGTNCVACAKRFTIEETGAPDSRKFLEAC